MRNVKIQHPPTEKEIISIDDTPEPIRKRIPSRNDVITRNPPPPIQAKEAPAPKSKAVTSKIKNTLAKPRTSKGPKKFAKPPPRIYTHNDQSPERRNPTGYNPLPFKALPKERYDYRKLWAAAKARERQKKFYDKAKETKKEKTEAEKCLDEVLEYDHAVLKLLDIIRKKPHLIGQSGCL